MKKCGICKEEKESICFSKLTSSKDGLNRYCRICVSKKNKDYYKEYNATHDRYNPEYYLRNKEVIGTKTKEYYYKNKEKFSGYMRTYLNKNPHIRLGRTLMLRIKQRTLKERDLEKILGCTYDEFISHLENLMEDWMTWDNYGKYNGELNFGWDIDHIIPLSSSKTEDEVIKLNHYTNLQPLCSYINRVIKRANY